MGVHINPFTGKLDVVDSPSGDFSDLTLDLGTAAAPSISFDGDPTTGIYSPGTYQVAISTNGTGRLFVDSSGRVLVGADSTSGASTFYDDIVVTNTTAGTGAGITLVANATNGFNAVDFGDTDAVGRGRITYSHADDSLRIDTAGTERLRITSTGALNFVGAGTAGSTQAVSFNGSAPVNSLVIDSSGRVGLGTSSPSYQLDLDGGTTVDRRIQLRRGSDDTNQHMRIGWNGIDVVRASTTLANAQTTFSINQVGSDGTRTALYVDSYGKVGVGTTGPLAKFAVEYAVAGSGSDGIRLSDTTNTTVTLLGTTETTYSYAGVTGHNTLLYGSRDLAICADNANSGQIKFSTGGSEAMRVDASRRLLVGTSSSSTADTLVLANNSSSTNDAAVLRMRRSGTIASGDDVGVISFENIDGLRIGASIQCENDQASNWATGDSPGRLVFSTTADAASSPTERMRINNTGVLYTFSSATGGNYFAVSAAAGTTTSILRGAYGATANALDGTESILIYSNGNVVNTNNSYGSLSDIKLKENIVDASSQWSDIKALRPVNYNFKEGQTHTQLGLIAQEVELVSPGLVSESPDRDKEGNDLGTVTKSVNYSVLYMKAVKALQEAMERIETLEAKVAALESA